MDKARRIIEKLPSWLLTAVTVAAILWLTLVPRPLGDMKPELFPGADKVVHAIMFGGLALMILTDCSRSRGWHRLSVLSVIMAASISTLFGVVIELLQRDGSGTFLRFLRHAGRCCRCGCSRIALVLIHTIPTWKKTKILNRLRRRNHIQIRRSAPGSLRKGISSDRHG